jgi:flavorubredoxin
MNHSSALSPAAIIANLCQVLLLAVAWACMAQVQTALGAVLRDASAKELPCGVFGSFGWSGEAVDELESRLRV